MKIYNWTRNLRCSLMALGLCLPGAAVAADLDVNLVVNGGFETVDTAVSGPFTSVAISSGWVEAGSDTTPDLFAYPYSSGYSGAAVLGAGDYHFAGGFSTTADELQISQRIDVGSGASGALIATGGASFNLSAYFSGYLLQNDSSEVRVRFLDSANLELGAASVGGLNFVNAIPASDGTQRDWAQDFRFGLIPNATRAVEVEILASDADTNHDGYVDLVSFQVSAQPVLPVLDLTVNRDSGSIVLKNNTGASVPFSGYSITSSAGSLDRAAWISIADNSDADSGGGIDASNVWSELTAPGASGDLSEADLDSGQGTTLVPGQSITVNGWVASPAEDLLFEYVSSGGVIRGLVSYTGNDGAPFVPGDFDTDGDIDAADYAVLVLNQFASLDGPTTRSYVRGDFNRDGRNNHTDFVLFQDAFDSANGAGSFEALVTGVPEPAAAALAAFACSMGLTRRS